MCGGCGWLHHVWVLGSLLANREWGGFVCIRSVVVGFSLSVPLLASVLKISFPILPKCVRTLWMWNMCGVLYICFSNCLGGDVVMLGVECGY